MVLRLRKLFESIVVKAGAKPEDPAGEKSPDKNVVEAESVQITEVTDLEDLVNERTKDLEEAREQLRQLSNAAYPEPGKDEAGAKNALAQLLKSGVELPLQTIKLSPAVKDDAQVKEALASLQPEIELAVQSLKVSPEGVGEVKVGGAPAPLRPMEVKPPAEVKEPVVLSKKSEGGEKEQKRGETSDMISNIFNREDEQENPLAGLMASLPDTNLGELLDEALEIRAMLAEWREN